MAQSAWAEITAAFSASPSPVDVLPADPERALACLTALGITTRSWLGALVANAGGLRVDHGWLRVLGCGHDGLPGVGTTAAGGLVVAYDVMGGQFAWMPGTTPTVHYFAPDALAWEDLELGYGDWLEAMLSGSTADFYAALRWPGWEREVAGLPLDQGISAYPPPWSREGKGAVSRRSIPLAELVSAHQETARQLRGA